MKIDRVKRVSDKTMYDKIVYNENKKQTERQIKRREREKKRMRKVEREREIEKQRER